jgi:hypothetical protein
MEGGLLGIIGKVMNELNLRVWIKIWQVRIIDGTNHQHRLLLFNFFFFSLKKVFQHGVQIK